MARRRQINRKTCLSMRRFHRPTRRRVGGLPIVLGGHGMSLVMSTSVAAPIVACLTLELCTAAYGNVDICLDSDGGGDFEATNDVCKG